MDDQLGAATVPDVVERQRLVGLARDTWRRTRLRAIDGGPSAGRTVQEALTRYTADPEFRARVDTATLTPNGELHRRNVTFDDDLWESVRQLADRADRALYGTADAALRLYLDDVDG